MTLAGRLFDAYGAKIALILAAVTLGASILFLSVVDRASEYLAIRVGIGSSVIAFLLIVVRYFGVRFSGQVVMTSASRSVSLLGSNSAGAWYQERGAFVSLGFFLGAAAVDGADRSMALACSPVVACLD